MIQSGANLAAIVMVNLSIENAPDRIVRLLKKRAARHHRSLRGELLAIVEQAVAEPRALTPETVLAEVRRLGLRTPAEATVMIRKDRGSIGQRRRP
jgi:antitoxin FitA